jgi:hypothetical protein
MPLLLTVRDVLLVARSLTWVREDPKHTNHGEAVVHFLKGVGLDGGYAWCAAFVHHVGDAALGSQWPLPATASCSQLGEFAKVKGILMDAPQAGDVFLLWEAVKENGTIVHRFAHTGFVVSVNPDGSINTIEGNTNDDGSRDGWGVFKRTRHVKPDDKFVRWVNLVQSQTQVAA